MVDINKLVMLPAGWLYRICCVATVHTCCIIYFSLVSRNLALYNQTSVYGLLMSTFYREKAIDIYIVYMVPSLYGSKVLTEQVYTAVNEYSSYSLTVVVVCQTCHVTYIT